MNWTPGEDVIIPATVTDHDARKKYPEGWKRVGAAEAAMHMIRGLAVEDFELASPRGFG